MFVTVNCLQIKAKCISDQNQYDWFFSKFRLKHLELLYAEKILKNDYILLSVTYPFLNIVVNFIIISVVFVFKISNKGFILSSTKI